VHAFESVVFMQENMDIRDGFTTSSKEQLWSLVRVHELDEITSNGGKDRSVTKEHPRGLKRKRLNFMHGEPPSWTRGWHRQNGASGGAKCIITWGPTGVKGRPSRAGMGLGRSVQVGRPGPVAGSVRPPFPCTWRIFNPKVLEVPPFARERAIRTERPSTSARERRKISGGGSTILKEAPTSGEEGRHRRKRHHDQRCHV
jgi:hypothetical protein